MILTGIEQENLDFDVKLSINQFYTIARNFKFNHQIRLKFYKESPNTFFYIELKFEVNQNLLRP